MRSSHFQNVKKREKACFVLPVNRRLNSCCGGTKLEKQYKNCRSCTAGSCFLQTYLACFSTCLTHGTSLNSDIIKSSFVWANICGLCKSHLCVSGPIHLHMLKYFNTNFNVEIRVEIFQHFNVTFCVEIFQHGELKS